MGGKLSGSNGLCGCSTTDDDDDFTNDTGLLCGWEAVIIDTLLFLRLEGVAVLEPFPLDTLPEFLRELGLPLLPGNDDDEGEEVVAFWDETLDTEDSDSFLNLSNKA